MVVQDAAGGGGAVWEGGPGLAGCAGSAGSAGVGVRGDWATCRVQRPWSLERSPDVSYAPSQQREYRFRVTGSPWTWTSFRLRTLPPPSPKARRACARCHPPLDSPGARLRLALITSSLFWPSHQSSFSFQSGARLASVFCSFLLFLLSSRLPSYNSVTGPQRHNGT